MELDQVKTMNLRPGDTLVLRVNEILTKSMEEHIRHRMAGYFPQNSCIVLSKGMELEIVQMPHGGYITTPEKL